MGSSKQLFRITGWVVFAIALTVYFFSAERTGSLWDCGEFILGAYKLQVVHPPGAPLFLLIGRLFAWIGSIFSDDPANIAFAVNMMSSTCTAFAAAFIAWVTMDLTKLAFVGRDAELDNGQSLATAGAGLIAGLTTAFATSIWFSAVEGEVYAMSTFFTTLTLWSTVKWYTLPDTPNSDRWLLFTVYAGGLSIGVHLLSLLTFPALGLFYYFKKYKNHNILGMAAAAGIGVVVLGVIQKFIIVGIPVLWSKMELLMVNSFGLPFHSGLIPTILIIGAIFYFGLNYAHKKGNQLLQLIMVGSALVVISFSTLGVVVVRANASTPVNMNAPSDAMRLIPYLNREQYGERALLYGPHFAARYSSIDDSEDRYGRVGNRYEVVDQKISLEYSNKDKMLFPRMGGSENLSGAQVVLSSPLDSFFTATLYPQFTWESMALSSFYGFRIVRGTDFDNGELFTSKVETANTSLTLSKALENGQYTWGVNAENSTSKTAYTTRFIWFDNVAPLAATPNNPIDNASQTDGKVVFNWTRPTDSGTPLYDSLFLYSDPGLTTLIQKVSGAGQTYSDSLSPGDYYWRIRATDRAGNIGTFSTSRKLTIQ